MSTTLQARLGEIVRGPGLARHLAGLRLGLAALWLVASGLGLDGDDRVASSSVGWVSMTALLLMLEASRPGFPPAGWPRLLPAFLVPAEPVNVAVDQRRLRRLPDVWFTWTLRRGWQMQWRNEKTSSVR
jgi:hypothetical protein